MMRRLALLTWLVAMGSACGGGAASVASSPSPGRVVEMGPGPCPVVTIDALPGLSLDSVLAGSRQSLPVVGFKTHGGSYTIEGLHIDVLAVPYTDDPAKANVQKGDLPFIQRLAPPAFDGHLDRTVSFSFSGVDQSGKAVAPGTYDVGFAFNAHNTPDATCTTNGGSTAYHGLLGQVRWMG